MCARARWTGVVIVVIATATAVIAVSRPAAAESCRIDHTVRHGDWGDAVLCVERALLERGYMTTNIDIRFGTSTVDAVRRFRGDHGLTRSGLVGPQAGRRLGIWARRAVPTHDPREVRLLGRSVRGHAIRAYRYGTGRGKPAVAIGQIHGNEPGGAMIAAFLRTRGSRRGVDLWVIDSVNPSGWRSQQRTNPQRRRPQPQLRRRQLAVRRRGHADLQRPLPRLRAGDPRRSTLPAAPSVHG